MRQNENKRADYNQTASNIQARQWANAARHKYLSRVLRTVAPRPSAVFGALGEQNLAHADRLAKLIWEKGGDPGLQVRFTTPKVFLGDDAHSRAPVVVRRAINQSVAELGEVLHLYKRDKEEEYKGTRRPWSESGDSARCGRKPREPRGDGVSP